jgi:hypothetical protein
MAFLGTKRGIYRVGEGRGVCGEYEVIMLN